MEQLNNPFMLIAVILMASSFVLSAILTAIISQVARMTGFVAHPKKDRFSSRVVPLGGGIAIFWTIALVIFAGCVIIKFVLPQGPEWLGPEILVHARGFVDKMPEITFVIILVSILHVIGLWDDLRGLGPWSKLVFQFIIAALAASMADIRLEFFIENRFLTAVLSAVWIVMIINAFNFLDNMDGLGAGIALIVSAVFFYAASSNGQVFISAMGLIFIGSLLGFLLFNFPPAKIFMGDSGSLVIGFFVALLSIKTTYFVEEIGQGIYAVFMPLIVLAVPLYDFGSVILLRLSQGKSPFVGDTQHFSHRLKRMGLTDRQVAITLYLATATTSLSAIFLYQVDFAGAILIFVQTIMILILIATLEFSQRHNTLGH